MSNTSSRARSILPKGRERKRRRKDESTKGRGGMKEDKERAKWKEKTAGKKKWREMEEYCEILAYMRSLGISHCTPHLTFWRFHELFKQCLVDGFKFCTQYTYPLLRTEFVTYTTFTFVTDIPMSHVTIHCTTGSESHCAHIKGVGSDVDERLYRPEHV